MGAGQSKIISFITMQAFQSPIVSKYSSHCTTDCKRSKAIRFCSGNSLNIEDPYIMDGNTPPTVVSTRDGGLGDRTTQHVGHIIRHARAPASILTIYDHASKIYGSSRTVICLGQYLAWAYVPCVYSTHNHATV